MDGEEIAERIDAELLRLGVSAQTPNEPDVRVIPGRGSIWGAATTEGRIQIKATSLCEKDGAVHREWDWEVDVGDDDGFARAIRGAIDQLQRESD